jgi:polysaccharide pyruvyl transferase WcaK-like protein
LGNKLRQVFGFSFYGAGNVGDDFMLAGYLDILSEAAAEVSGAARDIHSQKGRFPEVHWHDAESPTWSTARKRLLAEGAAWVGVGDTPFQMTSGRWFIDSLVADMQNLESMATVPMVMIGVGAEREVLQIAGEVKRIVDRANFIWTRDEASRQILFEVGGDPSRITTGADLAHIALSKLPLAPSEGRRYRLGLNYFSEAAETSALRALGAFCGDMASLGELCFISNERRPAMEKKLAASIRSKMGSTLRGRLRSWMSSAAERYPCFMPPYEHGSIEALASPYSQCETILSSRYHGLLAAAWAGCRVAALGGRSSKINALAEQFSIPVLSAPYTPHGLARLYDDAVRVDRCRLEVERDHAARMVRELVTMLKEYD